jgi:tetratricopeptide (TPR) repeat protein
MLPDVEMSRAIAASAGLFKRLAPRRVDDVSVSLCMIVKDEEANLEAALASVKGLVNEMVVVDTGSADATREIAKRHGARVFDFPWSDDFAAARNESIRHAQGEWIFWIDADDRLEASSQKNLAALFSDLPSGPDGYLMRCISSGGAGLAAQEVAHVRLFRNDPRLRFRYRIHEQIAPAIHVAGGQLHEADIAVRHEGYTDAALCRRKQVRNLRLLELECLERPLDPFLLYYRGTTLLDLDRPAEAVVSLELCASFVPKGTQIARMLPVHLAEAYGREGLHREARETLSAAQTAHPTDANVAFALAMQAYQAGDLATADGSLSYYFLAGSRAGPPLATLGDPTVGKFRARHLLAVVRYVQGRYDEAERDVRHVIETCPEVGDGWLLLGDALLAQGKLSDLAELVAKLAATRGTDIARILLDASRRASAGDHAGGLDLVEAALRAHGNHPYLVRAHARLGQPARDSESWRHAAYFLSARDLPGDQPKDVGRVPALVSSR